MKRYTIYHDGRVVEERMGRKFSLKAEARRVDKGKVYITPHEEFLGVPAVWLVRNTTITSEENELATEFAKRERPGDNDWLNQMDGTVVIVTSEDARVFNGVERGEAVE